MKLVKCPDSVDWSDPPLNTLFMAGGITGCPDWQSEMVEFLQYVPVTLINPRRDDFDTSDPSMSVEQISWEYDHLDRAERAMFWFPKETLCPITLYELGVQAGVGADILVGIEDGYARSLDIVEQLSHIRPDVTIVGSLQTLADEIASTCTDLPRETYCPACFKSVDGYTISWKDGVQTCEHHFNSIEVNPEFAP